MTAPTLTVEPPERHDTLSREIETALLQSLAALNTQATNTGIVITARDATGRRLGAVTGATSYGWLLVKLLWVEEAARGTGLGRRLMQSVEDEARGHGCHGAWLDTSNPRARTFYRGLGYADFGTLANAPDQTPADHVRWFMRKAL